MKRRILAIISIVLLCAMLLISCNEAINVIGASINENGELILEMSDGLTVNAGVVKGDKGDKVIAQPTIILKVLIFIYSLIIHTLLLLEARNILKT